MTPIRKKLIDLRGCIDKILEAPLESAASIKAEVVQSISMDKDAIEALGALSYTIMSTTSLPRTGGHPGGSDRRRRHISCCCSSVRTWSRMWYTFSLKALGSRTPTWCISTRFPIFNTCIWRERRLPTKRSGNSRRNAQTYQ